MIALARTKEPVSGAQIGGYTSVIVSYSTGIDSSGTLYWALQNFPRDKIWLLYCDTGCEYPCNEELLVLTAFHLGVRYVILRHPKGFLGLLLTERFKFPDAKNRWCTSILKTGITDKWIRANRHILGEKVLFLTGERRDESANRAKLPETEYHSTTLKTTRNGIFTCHWHRPVLDCEKGEMFERGDNLGIPANPCYEYLSRCSCMLCVLMPDRHCAENIRRYPELIRLYANAERVLQHTWKHKTSLNELFAGCLDVSDADAAQ